MLFQQARLWFYTGTLNTQGITGSNSSDIPLEGLTGSSALDGGSGGATNDEVFGVRRMVT